MTVCARAPRARYPTQRPAPALAQQACQLRGQKPVAKGALSRYAASMLHGHKASTVALPGSSEQRGTVATTLPVSICIPMRKLVTL